MAEPRTLLDLERGQRARIIRVAEAQNKLARQLEDCGLRVGEDVEILRRGLIGGSPLAVRVGRAVLALRKDEAGLVEVALS